jgi:hypothetical protein
MYDKPHITSNGLEPGMKVKVPDGRQGILDDFRLYEEGPNAPGLAAIQFINLNTGVFEIERWNLRDVSAICPCCHGTGRVIESER